MAKTVDVIIPVYKPGKEFQKLLDLLICQTYPVNRIIVINTEESFYPKDIRQPEGMELYHIKREEFDHGMTRDRAARMSDADLILFMTQDAVPANDMLVEELVKGFSDEKVGAAYARQIPHREHSPIERYTRNYNYPAKSIVKWKKDLGSMGIKTFFCSDVCAMYRKSLYVSLGGFQPQTIFNEDLIFCAHLIYSGYGIAYRANAKVIHSHDYSGIQQLKRYFDNGVSTADNFNIIGKIPAAGEGKKLVFSTLLWLFTHGYLSECFRLIYLSACKYVGYGLGRKYVSLPRPLVLKLTSNPEYWKHI